MGKDIATWPARRLRRLRSLFEGKNGIITGGSSGIGLALARRIYQAGANVTIIARDEGRLEQARREIEVGGESFPPSARPVVRAISADVTRYEAVERAIGESVDRVGEPDYLFTCAGAAFPGYFAEQEVSIFEETVALNYLGTVHAIKACIPYMVRRRSGHIILISSAAGVLGFIGYSSYAPTKWAVRGLADCLRNELLRYNIKVSVAYPPDTDTPGFARENKTKPPETKKISASGSLYPPDQVADKILQGIERGRYHLMSPDFLQNLLISLMAGVSPRGRPLVEIPLQSLMAAVAEVYSRYFDHIVRSSVKEETGDR